MIYPSFLKDKATIGVPAPSAAASKETKKVKYKNSYERLTNLGYNVVLSKNYYHCERGRSASGKYRGKEVNEMFKDKNIDMIICTTGGDFLVEALPYINFNLIKKNPKFVVGFSDPTGILFPITTKYDIATIYGTNFSSFGTAKLDKYQKDFLDLLKGNLKEYHNASKYEDGYHDEITGLENSLYTKKVVWKTLDNKPVKVKGRIIGGCLDLINELAGTKYDGTKDFINRYSKDGIIWYFDNCELSCEEVIRVLWRFKELGYFKNTKAVIFGRFGEKKTYYDYTVKECLLDSVLKELNIPIIYDVDFSHKAPCLPVINGSIANLTVKDGKGTISYELK